MNLFIVDDNPNTRAFLISCLPQLSLNCTLVGTAASIAEALPLVSLHRPEVLLLDIELPDGKGFDLLRKLEDFSGKVIFITAHDHYALQAIKFSAFDFLLKPIDVEELEQTLQQAAQALQADHQLREKLATLEKNLNTPTVQERKVILSDAENIYLVAIGDIVRCQSERNYTTFFLQDGRQITISQSIKNFEQLLPAPDFLRAHRSHLVHLKYFDRFEKKDGGTIRLQDGSVLPVAIRRKERLIEALKKYTDTGRS